MQLIFSGKVLYHKSYVTSITIFAHEINGTINYYWLFAPKR